MTLNRRHFIATAAAAGLGALHAAAPGAASAAPVPADADGATAADQRAAEQYRRLVPELFVPAAPAPEHSEVVVVGTGFGAAVSALRLAQAGARVTMLERGNRWPRHAWRAIHSPEVVSDGRAFWHRREFTGLSNIPVHTPSFGGVLDVTEYDGMQVWRGAAVGGGSVVFTGVLLEPERHLFEEVFGGAVPYEEMHATWYPKAREGLRAAPMPSDLYDSLPFGHSRRWDAAARAAGFDPQRLDGIWDWGVVRDELWLRSRRSATVGESNFGNANGSKRDLSLGYLAQAEATGRVGIHHGHVVHRIGSRPQGGYTVELSTITPTGEQSPRRVITCDRLVLGAGAVGTSGLLVRARAEGTLANLDPAVGSGFGTNGDGGLVMSGVTSDGMFQATPSASTILDETGPVPARLESWYAVGFPLNVGFLCSLGMVMDPTRGAFRLDAATDRVVLDWPRAANESTAAALRHVHAKLVAAAGGRPGVAISGAPEVRTDFTAHPLGGAVIGQVLDGYGRVRGHEGLYVMDGAAIPGSTGTANPSLTITALAERNIAQVIAAGR